jgi:hypothetical protein
MTTKHATLTFLAQASVEAAKLTLTEPYALACSA